MLFPQMRGYTPLRVGKHQITLNHQLALSVFAFSTIAIICWHFFGPLVSTSAAAATAISVVGGKVLPPNWSITDRGRSEAQGSSEWRRPHQLRKVVGLVFYGRPASVSILDCYLKRNLVSNGGILDEVIFLARTEKQEDLDWLDALVANEPKYSRVDVRTYGKSYASAYDICEDDVMYIKIDDDIVFFEDTTIPTIVRTRWEHPEYFLVSANIMNQPSLSWVHHHLGVVKPYLPEYTAELQKAIDDERRAREEEAKELAAKEKAKKAKAEKAKAEKEKPAHKPPGPRDVPGSPSKQRPSGAVKPASPSRPSNASPAPLYPSHPTNWRASLLPPWQGPDNFTVTGDFKSATIPHRWLPLPHGSVVDTTPIMATEYGAFTPALWHWTIAAQEHYSFLEHLENNELWRYKFHKWDYYYKRLGIQFIAIMGRDINLAKPLEQDDEAYFSEAMPAKLKRHAIVDGRAVAAHYSFAPQKDGMATTDVLDRYRSFAEENICAKGWR